MSIREFMSADHKRCDEVFAEFENLLFDGKVLEAKGAFEAVEADFEKHFAMEEKVLFVAFEENNQSGCGPTEVMRREHEQMRHNMGALKKALEENDKTRAMGLCESFHILTQQHNSKEEQILYVMCDNFLSDDADKLIKEMGNLSND